MKAFVLTALAAASRAFQQHPAGTSVHSLSTIAGKTVRNEADAAILYPQYPAYTLQVPVDHFGAELDASSNNATFGLRYWFDASHYNGGPVFLLCGGETSGSDRLQFLEKGLVQTLARDNAGIAVVLEHRYYGRSYPTENFSTRNLRFLTTQQAMADTDYFARNIVFPGLEDVDVTSATTPYVLYGGSYAGAFVAFLRKLYPKTFWGAIASSAVTEAIVDYWQYYEPILEYADQDCVSSTQILMNIVDNIAESGDTQAVQDMKALWNLGSIVHIKDFANALTFPISFWQSRNWDPEVSSSVWEHYCTALSTTSSLIGHSSELRRNATRIITSGGFGANVTELLGPLLGHVHFHTTQIQRRCGTLTAEECFTTHDPAFYARDDISQTWRLWPYQYCTQWGYLATGSGKPSSMGLPLIPRLMDINYSSKICRDAFNITSPPKIEEINQYGGWAFEYERVAFVDGEQDPWRPATPHAAGLQARNNTIEKPFLLIEGAVHHWDENSLSDDDLRRGKTTPAPVKAAQEEERTFVKEWIKMWHAEREAIDYVEHDAAQVVIS